MSSKKKQIRANFNEVCLKRDGYKCRICGRSNVTLEVHHITDRTELPNGGYVLENGITLCPEDHMSAEKFHISGGREWDYLMHPDNLYEKIGSSREKAEKASEKL